MQAFFRAVGAMCPTVYGLDFRLVGKLHGYVRIGKPHVCGNGFRMIGTNNAAHLTGLNEGSYMRALGGVMRPGDLVYDVGANVGYTALWLAKRFAGCGGIEVVGFEPDPRTAACMKRNVALNPRLNVSTEVAALGDFDGEAVLHTMGTGDGAASISARAHEHDVQKIQISVMKLDTYQKRVAGKSPNWLVLDVEGFGEAVVKGGIDTISSSGPGIAAEIHSVEERQGIHNLLAPLGYRVMRELKSLWGEHVIWLAF